MRVILRRKMDRENKRGGVQMTELATIFFLHPLLQKLRSAELILCKL